MSKIIKLHKDIEENYMNDTTLKAFLDHKMIMNSNPLSKFFYFLAKKSLKLWSVFKNK
jgi:hypothetical protein